jgi:hypothetical protein
MSSLVVDILWVVVIFIMYIENNKFYSVNKLRQKIKIKFGINFFKYLKTG